MYSFPVHNVVVVGVFNLANKFAYEYKFEVEVVMVEKGWMGCSWMWLNCGGRAVCFALIFAPAVEHAAKRGCSAGSVHCSWRLQIHQVIVRLAHPRVLALVTPPEEELCTLLEEAAWSGEAKDGNY